MKRSSLKISLYSLVAYMKIPIVGQLFGSEIFALLFLPYFKLKDYFKSNPLLIKLGLSYLALLIAFIISDIFVNNTIPENYLRGWANIIMSFVSVTFISYQLNKDNKNILYYLLFAGISFFLFRREIDPSLLQTGQTNIFKIYYMTGVNSFVLLAGLLSYKINKKIPLLIFFIYGIMCLFLDSRSNGAIFFISVLLISVKIFDIKLTKFRLVVLSILFLVILSFSYVLYVNSVLNGTIKGDNSQQLKKIENPYNPIALLETGRVDFFVSLEAINDRPIWGYGSWAEERSGKYARIMQMMQDSSQLIDEDTIPIHSILLTGWLWAGILGLITIICVFFIMLKKTWEIFRNSTSPVLIVLIPTAIDQFWHFFFSPFGHMRTTVPIFFALVIVEFAKLKKQNEQIKIK